MSQGGDYQKYMGQAKPQQMAAAPQQMATVDDKQNPAAQGGQSSHDWASQYASQWMPKHSQTADQHGDQYASGYAGKWTSGDENQTTEDYRQRYAGQWMPSKNDKNMTQDDYKKKYAGQWIPEVKNASDQDSWRDAFLNKYAPDQQACAGVAQAAAKRYPNATATPGDSHSVEALAQWRDAQLMMLDACLHKNQRKAAEDAIKDVFKSQSERIASEKAQAHNTHNASLPSNATHDVSADKASTEVDRPSVSVEHSKSSAKPEAAAVVQLIAQKERPQGFRVISGAKEQPQAAKAMNAAGDAVAESSSTELASKDSIEVGAILFLVASVSGLAFMTFRLQRPAQPEEEELSGYYLHA